jgi:hypothetical protein
VAVEDEVEPWKVGILDFTLPLLLVVVCSAVVEDDEEEELLRESRARSRRRFVRSIRVSFGAAFSTSGRIGWYLVINMRYILAKLR